MSRTQYTDFLVSTPMTSCVSRKIRGTANTAAILLASAPNATVTQCRIKTLSLRVTDPLWGSTHYRSAFVRVSVAYRNGIWYVDDPIAEPEPLKLYQYAVPISSSGYAEINFMQIENDIAPAGLVTDYTINVHVSF